MIQSVICSLKLCFEVNHFCLQFYEWIVDIDTKAKENNLKIFLKSCLFEIDVYDLIVDLILYHENKCNTHVWGGQSSF